MSKLPIIAAWLLGVLAVPPCSAAPKVLLDPLFQERCRRPCEYVGYSFDDGLDELRLMRAAGANACGTMSVWMPVEDATAPHGAGVASVLSLVGAAQIGQTFTTDRPITGAGFAAPTYFTENSGCTLALYAGAPEQWSAQPPAPLAMQTFANVHDNQTVWLTFPEVPVGTYYLEQSAPTGPEIGVWASGQDSYAGGRAYLNRRADPREDLELWVRAGGVDKNLVPPSRTHHPTWLGPSIRERMAKLGISFDCAVGNFNNGGFPYYPDWFLRRFPDMGEIDQNGQPVVAGCMGTQAPWPSNDHPVIVDGTRRYLRAVVSQLRDEANLLYWCMGGEALYATYLFGDRWTDYSANAVAHYRAWLGRKYGDVGGLNAAWGSRYATFGDITPPRTPGRDLPTFDWFRYRNDAMAERFRYHFAETKSADPSRLAVTCNHGNLFEGLAATKLGQDMNLYADVSDGWEMGQIMSDEDPDLYNLMWMRAAGTFGKPLCPVRLAYKKTNPRARGGGTSYTPEAARRYFWESVGTGAWHLGFIQWRGDLPDGEWGVKGTPAEAEFARIFAEWHRIEGYFDDAWPVKERVGLYLAQPTWTLDGFSPLWTRLHREFTQRQIGYRILCDDQILNGELRDCAIVICAADRVMDVACAKALRDYAAGGGTLLLIGQNAREDEQLRPYRADPFAGATVEHLSSDAPTLADDLERLVDSRRARYLRVAAKSDQPFYEAAVGSIESGHDAAFDLAGHRSVGQTFTTTTDGLAGVAVSVPTYEKKVTDRALTIEVRRGGPDGEAIAQKTFAPETLTDNAWHEIPVAPPAPVGKYCLRIVTPAGLPPSQIGVWGKSHDAYPGGTRIVDDAPADGDLELKLAYRITLPARAAIEAFALSDGLNAIAVLTNLSGGSVSVRVDVAADLVSEEARRVQVTDLASGTVLGTRARDALRPKVVVPAHRSAVLFLAAYTGPGDALARVVRLETSLAAVPAEAATARRAHLARAREALAANKYAKALASVMRAEARIPLVVTAEVRGGNTLAISARCPQRESALRLQARFVPLPGKVVELAASRAPGEYTASVPLAELGVRYDYDARTYVPYFGGLEVVVAGRDGTRAAQASCVVDVPGG